uniref:Organic cation transporter 1 n=1 Tax=Parasteatoda tepidariorum TaxID=114398 RepID=A0A2L2XW13_PARTP
MEFEDILRDVGDFGSFQKILIIVFLIPTFTFIPWISLNAVFVSSTPDHWCNVPELTSSFLSIDEQKYLIRPPKDPHCTRYDLNYSALLTSQNLTIDPKWPVKKCDLGWNYDTTNYDETAVTKWNLVCEDDYYKSMVVSFVFVGVIFFTPLYGFISDRCGRKPTFLGLALLIAVTEMASAFSQNFTLFLFFRLIIGSTMSSMYCLGYIIVLELVKPDLRARVNGIATNCWTGGLCLLSLIAYLTRSWVYLSIVMSVAAACLLFFYRVLPESPSWLISQERYEDAARILEKISISNQRHIPFEELIKNIQALGKIKKESMRQKNSPIDFLKYPVLRKRFLLSVAAWIGVSIPYYGLQANVTNLSGNEFINFFLVSIVEVPAHLITWWLLNNIGRKKTVEISYVVCALSCLIPAFAPRESSYIGVITTLLAKAGASAAFMGQYQLCPELFPTSLRGVGMGFASTVGVGSTLLAPFIVRLNKYGYYIPYLIFAVICVMSCFCVSFLPETLNKVLPQTVEDVERCVDDNDHLVCGLKKRQKFTLEMKLSISEQNTKNDVEGSKDIFTIS